MGGCVAACKGVGWARAGRRANQTGAVGACRHRPGAAVVTVVVCGMARCARKGEETEMCVSCRRNRWAVGTTWEGKVCATCGSACGQWGVRGAKGAWVTTCVKGCGVCGAVWQCGARVRWCGATACSVVKGGPVQAVCGWGQRVWWQAAR